MPNLSRRYLVTTAAAFPALAMPAVAAELGPDPVFAAIDEWRDLYAKHGAACAALGAYEGSDASWDTEEHDDLDTRAENACHAASDAVRKLCLTVPTTAAGMAAVLRLVEDDMRGDDQFLTCYMSGGDNPDDLSGKALLRSLRKGAERWAAEAVRS